MKKTKVEKGITLIALIITIVVLLVLAVVTIGAIKNSKIITHAQNASDDYTIAQEKEQIQLALSEWQIQKNIPGNTQTFKSVMETELSNSATVGGDDNGSVTITFTKTKNEYMVNNEGKITNIKISGQPTALEKYILGEDLKGRDIEEIDLFADLKILKDIDTEIGVMQIVGYDGVFDENDERLFYYIKYNGETYGIKIKYIEEKDTYYTSKLIKLYEQEEGRKVGKIVKYDNKLWTILYDDDTNGLQMVSNEAYKYKNSDFCLGYNDSLINDWSKLDITTNEFKNSDINKNGVLDTNIEKSIYSYNNAIITLNDACTSVVTPNNNIIDIRCVGSNPLNKNKESEELFTNEKLSKIPTDNPGIVNGVGKCADTNYIDDFERMLATDSFWNCDCWLASRWIYDADDKSGCAFYVRNLANWVGAEGGIKHIWAVRKHRSR